MEKLVCFLALLSLVQYGLCYDPLNDAGVNIDIDKRAAKVACVPNGTKCNASSQVCCNDPTFVCGRGKRTGDEFLCLARGDLSCVGPNSKCNATVQCCESSSFKCQEKTGICKQCVKDGKLCEDGSPCCSSGSSCTKLYNGTSMCLQPGVTPKMLTTTTTTKVPPTTTAIKSAPTSGGIGKEGEPCNEATTCEEPTLCSLSFSHGSFCTRMDKVPPPPAGCVLDQSYRCDGRSKCCESLPGTCVLTERGSRCDDQKGYQNTQAYAHSDAGTSSACRNHGEKCEPFVRCCGELICLLLDVTTDGKKTYRCVTPDEDVKGCAPTASAMDTPIFYTKCNPQSKPCCNSSYFECLQTPNNGYRCMARTSPIPDEAPVTAPAPPRPADDPGCQQRTTGCSSSSECCGYNAGDHGCMLPPVGAYPVCLYCAKDGEACRRPYMDSVTSAAELAKGTGVAMGCCNSESACGRGKDNSGPKCMPKGDIECVDMGFMCGGSNSGTCCSGKCQSGFFNPTVSYCQ